MTPAPARRLPKPLRIVRARPRLFLCAALGVVVGLCLPEEWRLGTRGLVGWNAAVWTYLAAVGIMIARSEHQDIHRRAALQDEGQHTILILAALSAIAAFGAIVAQLATANKAPYPVKELHIALAVATIIGSWLFLHMTFALHYAHEFFRIAKPDAEGKSCSGIAFPGTERPDYPDFLYFSYVIGVACATADVNITSAPVRRLATLHGVLSFFYNNAVLAMTINIGAGFMGS
ncbi:DUF1345 domain-containing protein [Rhodoblastus acidophilus]|uniref:DUF1345 domain-containing protein n=1 Tax=Candidatus Rhodoblastus alkanivorans TaxID=2954117 RepID=A0ABS9Z2E6_9HYPH|nr:DUF1345 domain-containing protein [Candidatus Rhodoblastus alkanivorans]MCI4678044.1 DUF1345 domain-containing protein [Candidatus Rhodoblastus alkanivorans]MCI4681615.1 DUF1345 domain-containing protein [Candidatus Rhodoblastus alkanivorans]MDI4642663.1 DUF1345 domain-containing protein [Rhodoblastus acidophilus]